LAAGCGDSGLPTNGDLGNADLARGGDLAGNPDLSGGPDFAWNIDLAIPPSCVGLSESACLARADCVADRCQECACTPQFAACRAVTDPPTVCTQPPCAFFQCCHDGSACNQTASLCVAPGQVLCGGACPLSDGCMSDVECQKMDPNTVCEAVPCVCSTTGLSCTASCAQAGCGEGQLCGSDGHCQAMKCSTDGDCPIDFQCVKQNVQQVCARRTCNVDGDCPQPNNYCVDGACYSDLGKCEPAPA
jgi:hypothetical protein